MDGRRLTPPLWGGVECTVARIGDRYVDQTRRTGHHDRDADIERIASLGVRALRYPVLWERSNDWSWTDRRLAMLREAGIEPIATLLHHGSGPLDTNLLDDEFPRKFAEYAREVALRYPWLRMFTPINEPLTTARFSALYGVWYPHACNDAAFVRALYNETAATALAMRAIREVIPNAQLVQTEDLSKTFSTPELAEQAEYENARRFAVFDLLTGHVDMESPFFRWAQKHGMRLDNAALSQLRCPPDIIGLNYYVTSERFLDHRTSYYPGVPVGGNDKGVRYVDVEAVRACSEGLAGLRELANRYWQRYGLPIAVTEAHLGCTPEEQLRWVDQLYDETCAMMADGVDVRGFTVWSLFGACDWDSLLTEERGSYEPGAYDVRSGEPRETAIAQWMRATVQGRRFDHPALDGVGWWRRPQRLRYGPFERGGGTNVPAHAGEQRPVLVLGSSPVALKIAKACVERGLAVRTNTRPLRAAVRGESPWLVLDARMVEEHQVHAVLDEAIAHAAPERQTSTVPRDERNVIRIDTAVRKPHEYLAPPPEDCA